MEDNSWFKIFFSQGDIHQGLALNNAMADRLVRTGFPADLALFRKRNDGPVLSLTYYLPPSAAAYCSDLLELYSAEPCDNPGASEVEVEVGNTAQSALLAQHAA